MATMQRVAALEIEVDVMSKRERVDGYTSHKTATRKATIVIEIDPQALLRQLGRRAALSVGRKSRACSGAVIVRAINVVDTPVE